MVITITIDQYSTRNLCQSVAAVDAANFGEFRWYLVVVDGRDLALSSLVVVIDAVNQRHTGILACRILAGGFENDAKRKRAILVESAVVPGVDKDLAGPTFFFLCKICSFCGPSKSSVSLSESFAPLSASFEPVILSVSDSGIRSEAGVGFLWSDRWPHCTTNPLMTRKV